MKRSPFSWLERLSLDAVLVAALWGIALGKAAQSQVRAGDILVLTLATWLTYVADRLWDTRPGSGLPESDRHRYYKRYRERFLIAWAAVFFLSVVGAYLILPSWKFLWGWVLVFLILVYICLLGRPFSLSQRLFIKRMVVPVVFTSGAGWMSESWRTTEGRVATLVLLVGALANVLLISYQEHRDRDLPDWLPVTMGTILFGLVVVCNFALIVYWPAGAAGLFCAAVYFILFLQVKSSGVGSIRMWVDAALADTAILLLILQIWA